MSSGESNYEHLLFETHDRVATITINRPEAANGLNQKMGDELAHVAQACDFDKSIKAVILTGNGRFFSAGGDVKSMDELGDSKAAGLKRLADTLHRAISSFARMDAPLIVAVNGVAAGAGFSMAIMGDLVIASDQAAFTMAYSNVGLSPDGSSSYYLPRLVGLRKAQELMFTNRKLDAQEALDMGLVTKVVPGAVLMDSALEYAAMFKSGSVGSNASIKQLLLATLNNSLETQMELESRSIAACAGSVDGNEGITAFAEKRKPSFS